MNRLTQVLTSRTTWTIVVMVAINTLPYVKDHASQQTIDVLNGILGALAVYLHVNPSQKYPLQKPLK